jgi:hypothetical protein
VSINRERYSCGRLSPRDFSARFTNLALIAGAFMMNGCGGPNETTRDNRRLTDAILTAVTIRNSKELSNDQQLLEARRAAGKLSEETFSILNDAITEAASGEWNTAETQLYEFRKQTPFPK